MNPINRWGVLRADHVLRRPDRPAGRGHDGPADLAGTIFNYMQYSYDPTVTAVGTLMLLFAAVAIVAIERVVASPAYSAPSPSGERARSEFQAVNQHDRSSSLRVVVIGAGVVGAAVAAGLTRRGADVTVLEARRPGAGTTTTSFAWINAGNKNPDSYHALNHAGVHAHHEFAGDGAPWFFPTGNLEWAVNENDRSALARRIDKAHERDYPLQRLTAQQAAALEPDLIGQPPDTEYVLFPTEAHTYPALLLARLLGEAKDRGATVISPEPQSRSPRRSSWPERRRHPTADTRRRGQRQPAA
jgi:hypothetical protein